MSTYLFFLWFDSNEEFNEELELKEDCIESDEELNTSLFYNYFSLFLLVLFAFLWSCDDREDADWEEESDCLEEEEEEEEFEDEEIRESPWIRMASFLLGFDSLEL